MRRIVFAICTAVFLNSTLKAQIDISDGFDDGNIAQWDVFDLVDILTGQPHADITFPDGALRLNVPPTPDPELGLAVAAVRRPETVFSDFEMSVDVLQNQSSVDGIIGLGARLVAPFTGYFLFTSKLPEGSPEEMIAGILRLNGGDADPVLIADGLYSLPDDSGFKFEFRGNGSSLSADLFALSDTASSLLTLSADDATYSAGYGEIAAGSGSNLLGPNFESFGDATFDNFSLVATVPEPSGLLLLVLAAGGSLWICRRMH